VITNLNMNAATRLGFNSLILLGGVVALYLGQTILIPTIIALLLAAMLWPATLWLNQHLRFHWGIACLVVVSGLIIVNLLIMAGFFLAIPKMLQTIPRADEERQQIELYKKFRDRLERISPVELDESLLPKNPEHPSEIRAFQYITESLQKSVPSALLSIARYTTNYLWQWILIMFILFFLLLEGRMLIRRVVEIFGPSKEVQTKARQVLSEMARQVRTYLVWRTIINIGVALFVGLVYRWAHLSQPWTWAVLTAVLFYIPYLGPIIAGMPPVIDAFISNEHPMVAVGIMLFYLVVTIFEGYVIFPVVMGRNMEINATTVMLACLFWELVWGIVGLFLAMPLMAAIKAICYHVPGWRPWANLMSITEVEPESAGLDPSRPEVILDNGSDAEKKETATPVRSSDMPSVKSM
jgi:predicted PurR-regulated permease PerM